ncbi:hypothetical protein J3F84DRAFT_389261 [Trichoderma pleuroticola]
MHLVLLSLGLGAPPGKPPTAPHGTGDPPRADGRPRIALERMYQWPLELSKLIKLPWFANTEQPAPTHRPVSSKPQPATLPARICRQTAALRCAMPPRQCRVIGSRERCHDLPRALALVRKRHRTVGKSEKCTCFYQPGPGVSPLGLGYQHLLPAKKNEPVRVQYEV